MFVLMIRLICAIETAKVAGTIWRSTRRTPGSRNAATTSTPMRGNTPTRSSAGTWNASCAMPPAMTATASASTGGCTCGATNSEQPMNDRFSSTGVNAGTAKRRHVLRIADAPATRPISAMYGNMILVSSTAKSKPSSTTPLVVGSPQRSAFRPPASSQTTTGVPTMPITVTATSDQVSTVAT